MLRTRAGQCRHRNGNRNGRGNEDRGITLVKGDLRECQGKTAEPATMSTFARTYSSRSSTTRLSTPRGWRSLPFFGLLLNPMIAAAE